MDIARLLCPFLCGLSEVPYVYISIFCHLPLPLSHEGVTIGFEEITYLAEEPVAGVMALQVCVVLMGGMLGRELQVVPEWQEGTARGKSIDH